MCPCVRWLSTESVHVLSKFHGALWLMVLSYTAELSLTFLLTSTDPIGMLLLLPLLLLRRASLASYHQYYLARATLL